ncbi:MAG: helix-turn-helix domain-containing protein [Anaerolineae bacterium]|nr:helix-turn-helix domain-containing protein [Anaerolineae bacterium]
MDDRQEFQRRRRAIRLRLQGIPHKSILEKVRRSRGWLSKWQKRFEQQGISGLRTHSRRPHHTPGAYSARIVRLIVRTRRRLVKQKVGLRGARAIRRELYKVFGKQTPSLTTINRVLQKRRLVSTPSEIRPAYFPKPLTTINGILHALDWTCRYLEDGPKVYAFRTLNLRTRACTQSIATDKSSETVIRHGLQTWKTLGIPHFLQLDNDAAFCGGYKAPRIFGQFVRLCLFVGIELIFLPIAEPQCNGEVEELNGLWGHAFWKRRQFTSFAQVCRTSPTFIYWYMTEHALPFLDDATPQQAQQHESIRRLLAKQIVRLPNPLPITAGRIHFIRQVKPDGTITVLNEPWKVGKRLARKFVWTTLITHCRRLEIWYQRSAHHPWRLLKDCAYDIPETVARLKPECVHSHMARHRSRCPEPSTR